MGTLRTTVIIAIAVCAGLIVGAGYKSVEMASHGFGLMRAKTAKIGSDSPAVVVFHCGWIIEADTELQLAAESASYFRIACGESELEGQPQTETSDGEQRFTAQLNVPEGTGCQVFTPEVENEVLLTVTASQPATIVISPTEATWRLGPIALGLSAGLALVAVGSAITVARLLLRAKAKQE